MHFDIVVANPPFSLDKWGADGADADRYQPLPSRRAAQEQGRLRLHPAHGRDASEPSTRPRGRDRAARRAVPWRGRRARSARS